MAEKKKESVREVARKSFWNTPFGEALELIGTVFIAIVGGRAVEKHLGGEKKGVAEKLSPIIIHALGHHDEDLRARVMSDWRKGKAWNIFAAHKDRQDLNTKPYGGGNYKPLSERVLVNAFVAILRYCYPDEFQPEYLDEQKKVRNPQYKTADQAKELHDRYWQLIDELNELAKPATRANFDDHIEVINDDRGKQTFQRLGIALGDGGKKVGASIKKAAAYVKRTDHEQAQSIRNFRKSLTWLRPRRIR